MATIGIIIARAGSKGLTNKNVADLHGRPMIAYTIDHTLAASRLDRIVLSTDGEAIAAVARKMGVEVIDRPAALATDTARVDSVARHAAVWCEQRHHTRYDHAVILYGNVPVRPANLIDLAVERLITTGADSVQSVAAVGKTHPYWMKTVGGRDGDAGDELRMFIDNPVYRRQDLPLVYMLDGGIIAVTRSSLFHWVEDQPHAFLGTNRRAVVTQPGEVIDVDNELDLALAEAVLRLKQERGEGIAGPFKRHIA
jgi:CMP-N-acetylneuraminic acid synthetase